MTGTGDKRTGFGSTLGGILYSGRNLFKCRGRFFQRCGLLFGALGQVVGGRLDLVGTGINAAGILGNAAHGCLQLVGRGVEIVAYAIQRFGERLADPVGEVSVCQMRKAICQVVDRKLHVGSFLRLLLFAGGAFLFGKAAVGAGLFLELGALDRIGAEHGDCFGHMAHFVLAAEARNLLARLTAGK
ncbi:hypothetical protein D3C80_374270 [compost metagenome]